MISLYPQSNLYLPSFPPASHLPPCFNFSLTLLYRHLKTPLPSLPSLLLTLPIPSPTLGLPSRVRRTDLVGSPGELLWEAGRFSGHQDRVLRPLGVCVPGGRGRVRARGPRDPGQMDESCYFDGRLSRIERSEGVTCPRCPMLLDRPAMVKYFFSFSSILSISFLFTKSISVVSVSSEFSILISVWQI